MSGYIIRLTFIIGGALAMWFAFQYAATPDSSGRGRQSSSINHTEKSKGPLTANIFMLEDSNGLLRLQGFVTSEKPLSNVKLTWGLPASVELVEGVVEGEGFKISPDSPVAVNIVIRSLNNSNKQIHFAASSHSNEFSFASIAELSPKIMEPTPVPPTNEFLRNKVRF